VYPLLTPASWESPFGRGLFSAVGLKEGPGCQFLGFLGALARGWLNRGMILGELFSRYGRPMPGSWEAGADGRAAWYGMDLAVSDEGTASGSCLAIPLGKTGGCAAFNSREEVCPASSQQSRLSWPAITVTLVLQRIEVADGMVVICPRCGSKLRSVRANTVAEVLAASFSGLLFFIPAVFQPLLTLDSMGMTNSSSLLESFYTLYEYGYYLVGFMVLITAIIFPLIKLAVFFCASLCLFLKIRTPLTPWLLRTIHRP